ncbi:unnamed protein product, partial [Iphiclides podalirius]
MITALFHKHTGQRDVSEYCRRRVLPSVFLGRHVKDANSHVLHFSRLELPYSCSISVRAESGSNIILVIQYVSDNSIKNSCTKDEYPLLVYEIGETFGGYWGPLPDSVMRQESNASQFYTLPATRPTTTTDISDGDDSYDESEDESATLKLTQQIKKITKGDYFEIEVPLVNISGNFSVGQLPSESVDDVLDILDGDKPREGVLYETSILPILQFSMVTAFDQFRGDFTTENLKFVTPDSRLFYRTKYRRTQFRVKNIEFANKRPSLKRRKFFTNILPYTVVPSTRSTEHVNDLSLPFTNLTIEHFTKPQEIIDKIINSLRRPSHVDKNHDASVQKILDLQNSSDTMIQLS